MMWSLSQIEKLLWYSIFMEVYDLIINALREQPLVLIFFQGTLTERKGSVQVTSLLNYLSLCTWIFLVHRSNAKPVGARG
jgi:hypothetical protein